MERPLLSVVIPVHNVAAYIDRNLQSIVTQTYANLDIIIVDDGSTDQTAQMVDGWAKQDDRIHVVHLPQNKGISRARNVGLTYAKGRYITFVDGDDWCEATLFEFYIQHMVQKQLDLMICGYYVDPKGQRSDPHHITDQYLSQKKLIRLVRKMASPIRGYNWNKCYRLDVIRNHQLYFDEALSLMEDQVFNIAYILKTKRYLYNSRPLYHYCQRSDSSIHRPSMRKGRDVCLAIATIQNAIWQAQLQKRRQHYKTKQQAWRTNRTLKKDRRQS